MYTPEMYEKLGEIVKSMTVDERHLFQHNYQFCMDGVVGAWMSEGSSKRYYVAFYQRNDEWPFFKSKFLLIDLDNYTVVPFTSGTDEWKSKHDIWQWSQVANFVSKNRLMKVELSTALKNVKIDETRSELAGIYREMWFPKAYMIASTDIRDMRSIGNFKGDFVVIYIPYNRFVSVEERVGIENQDWYKYYVKRFIDGYKLVKED